MEKSEKNYQKVVVFDSSFFMEYFTIQSSDNTINFLHFVILTANFSIFLLFFFKSGGKMM